MIEFPDVIPLLINGEDYLDAEGKYVHDMASGHRFQGADIRVCDAALASSALAFESWSQTTWQDRRRLLFRLAQVFRENLQDLKELQMEEIHTSPAFADLITTACVETIEETASMLVSEVFTGHVQPVHAKDALGLVLHEPMGVVLGIAAWNAPSVLALRAILALVAAGNTAILKGSELSPRTHYFIANLFRTAGFPPGVVNFVLHRPEDAKQVFDRLIEHDAVRKCTFTGSSAVGRSIAAKCGSLLKPVLLELGGKNVSIVLEDADIEKAAEACAVGATLNNGQICMSTDTVYVMASIADEFNEVLRKALGRQSREQTFNLIQARGKQTVDALIDDAREQGATVETFGGVAQTNGSSEKGHDDKKKVNGNHIPNGTNGTDKIPKQQHPPKKQQYQTPATLLLNTTIAMKITTTETFGPVLTSSTITSGNEAVSLANASAYGLSSSIWTRHQNHEALRIAKQLKTGAVHVNGMTVHDEATLPHGGVGFSGYGRFNAQWGLREFLNLKTVVLNP